VAALDDAIGALGGRIVRRARIGGGQWATVERIDLADGRALAAKRGRGMALEGWMLQRLAATPLPVPRVHHAGDDLLVMDLIEGEGRLDAAGERHAAELLAALHDLPVEGFGLERDTVIGSLVQPNPKTENWIDFFRDQRLLYMARQARLPREVMSRIDRLAGRLDRYIARDVRPSLLHGDLWAGNLLARGGRVVAAIDPAIYQGDAEIELAFGTLFGPFDRAFFERYQELRPIREGFFEHRRDLYNLYPLLVHVRLFGGGYLGTLVATLDRLRG